MPRVKERSLRIIPATLALLLFALTACNGKEAPVDKGKCGTQICVKLTVKCENPGKTPASGLFTLIVRAKDEAALAVTYRFEAIDDNGQVAQGSGAGAGPVQGKTFVGEKIAFGAPASLRVISADGDALTFPRRDPTALCSA